jgi:hypothetical protein
MSHVLFCRELWQETDCWGEMTHVVFCRESCHSAEEQLHPRSYTVEELEDGILRSLRAKEGSDYPCDVEGALRSAAHLLKPVASLFPPKELHAHECALFRGLCFLPRLSPLALSSLF